MSKETLSKASELFIGKGRDRSLENLLGRTGAPFSPKVLVSLGAPAVADADYLIKAATGAELPDTETVTYAAATDSGASPLDAAATKATIYPFGATTPVSVWAVGDGAEFGRTLAAAVSHGSAVVAMTILITGYDYLDRLMTEQLSIAATGTSQTAAGKKAFAYVSSVAITAAGNAEANTLNLGTGSILGLPYKLAKAGHMTSASLGGVQERVGASAASGVCGVVAAITTAASATTGDVRGTVVYNGTLNGTAEAFAEYYLADRNSGAGLVGVAQA